MLGVHAFGAVINVSAVVIMADRLARVRPLEPNQAQLLSRSFSAVAFHSPFIGGVALALAYTPGSSPLVLMAYGVPLALAAFLLLTGYAYSRREDVARFRGYPVHPEDLRVPVALGATVLAAAALTSGYPVLTLITLLTPLVVAAALLRRGGVRGLWAGLTDYVHTRAPEMGGELALFLGAGVMAAGLVSASGAAGGWVFLRPSGRLPRESPGARLHRDVGRLHPSRGDRRGHGVPGGAHRPRPRRSSRWRWRWAGAWGAP